MNLSPFQRILFRVSTVTMIVSKSEKQQRAGRNFGVLRIEARKILLQSEEVSS